MTKNTARILLRNEMARFSEDRWCAGWLTGLEYVLWDYLKEPTNKRFRPADKQTLTELHKEAGGWWYWKDAADPRESGPKFVTTKKWLKMVEERAKSEQEKAS